MGSVFLSYRRGDSDGQARALVPVLSRYVGKTSVFIDVDGIAPGRDFRRVLKERLDSCSLMLVLIGREWLDAKDASGRRRLEDPDDFVRQEIGAALKRNIAVTPVLLEGAKIPPADSLPDDIKDLAFRNAFELSHTRWDSDVNEMVRRFGLAKRRTRTRVASLAVVVVVVGLAVVLILERVGWIGPRRMGPQEPNINRNANDLYPDPIIAANALTCSDLCGREPRCEAFTFTDRRGDPEGRGNCWLKYSQGVPTRVEGNGYVSGVKLGRGNEPFAGP